MPEMIPLGWFHTIIAIIALITGFYTLAVYKVITPGQRTGQVYLACTLVTAVTALMIYQHGAFGPAHGLVPALLALAGGLLVTRLKMFEAIAEYFRVLLFHGNIVSSI